VRANSAREPADGSGPQVPELLSEGTVRNHAELARLGHVSRPRMCQILMLTNLAPTIQEALVFLPKTVRGRDRITEHRLKR
jgi:hypothetical protein